MTTLKADTFYPCQLSPKANRWKYFIPFTEWAGALSTEIRVLNWVKIDKLKFAYSNQWKVILPLVGNTFIGWILGWGEKANFVQKSWE